MKYIVITMAVLSFNLVYYQNKVSDNSKNILYDISQIQKDAINIFLNENKGWTLAYLKDNTDKERIVAARIENPEFEPYYTQCDMNNDGIVDFAIAVIKNEKFGVVWFKGTKDKNYVSQWINKDVHLHEGSIKGDDRGLWIDGGINTDNLALFSWSKRQKRMVSGKH
jgi:hypothetical protein